MKNRAVDTNEFKRFRKNAWLITRIITALRVTVEMRESVLNLFDKTRNFSLHR